MLVREKNEYGHHLLNLSVCTVRVHGEQSHTRTCARTLTQTHTRCALRGGFGNMECKKREEKVSEDG